MMPSILDAPPPVSWFLARPLANRHFEFFAGLNTSSALSLTRVAFLARRFPTARAAYHFAGQRRDLRDFIVTRRHRPGRPRA